MSLNREILWSQKLFQYVTSLPYLPLSSFLFHNYKKFLLQEPHMVHHLYPCILNSSLSFKSWIKYQCSEILPWPVYLKSHPLLCPYLTYPSSISNLIFLLIMYWLSLPNKIETRESRTVVCSVPCCLPKASNGAPLRWWWKDILRNSILVDVFWWMYRRNKAPTLTGPQPPRRGRKKLHSIGINILCEK